MPRLEEPNDLLSRKVRRRLPANLIHARHGYPQLRLVVEHVRLHGVREVCVQDQTSAWRYLYEA